MKQILTILRLFGVAVGIWWLVASAIGFQQGLSTYSGTLPSSIARSPVATLAGNFAPVVALAIMLLVPWSRIHSSAVWWPLFGVFSLCALVYLWQLYASYITLWRRNVLLEQGIPLHLIFFTVFILIQLAAVLALRSVQFNTPSDGNRYA